MQQVRYVRPSDATDDVPVRRWKRLKRCSAAESETLPEEEGVFEPGDGAPAVSFSKQQCESYNALASMDCILDAVEVADFMCDDEKMTMLATAAMTRCASCHARCVRGCPCR